MSLKNGFELRLSGFIPFWIREFYHPTVGLVLCSNDQIIMVQPTKDTTGRSWRLPQGGIKPDESIIVAARREVSEELGIPGGALKNCVLLDGGGVNPLPAERKQRGDKDKLLIFVVAYVSHPERIVLNARENTAWQLVGDQCSVRELMGRADSLRPEKFTLTCKAINESNALGFLSWSCSDILPQTAVA